MGWRITFFKIHHTQTEKGEANKEKWGRGWVSIAKCSGRVGNMLYMAVGYKNYIKFKLGTYAREALLESYVVCNSVL